MELMAQQNGILRTYGAHLEHAPYFEQYHDPDGRGLRQRDRTVWQIYDAQYLQDRYTAIDANVRALAAERIRVLEAFVPREAKVLLDFGCGTGRFVEAAQNRGWLAHGHDIIDAPGVLPWSRCKSVPWEVVTFFDSLEHLPDPAEVVNELAAKWVMVSVPNCAHPDEPDWFMGWKHRRPGEHLTHWNRRTLDPFFAALGYRPVMWSHFEDQYRPNPQQKEPNILSAIYRK